MLKTLKVTISLASIGKNPSGSGCRVCQNGSLYFPSSQPLRLGTGKSFFLFLLVISGRECIIINMLPDITYKIIDRSSFTYNEKTQYKCPPDFAVEGLSEMLCDDEVSALKEAMGNPEMGFVDVMMIHTFCIVAQKEQITPLTFLDQINVSIHELYVEYF